MIKKQKLQMVLAVMVAIVAMATGSAMAAITVVNADFNDNGGLADGAYQDDVVGWFDDTLRFSSATHDDRNHSFVANTTPHCLFASGGRVGSSGERSYIYQNIGTREVTDNSMTVSFDMGRPLSPGSFQTIEVIVGVYQSPTYVGADGPAGYLPDGADVFLIDTQTITLVDHSGDAENAETLQALLDLSASNSTDNLFLLLETGAASVSFFQVDDLSVAAVPEPATLGLLGLGGLVLRRRRK